MLFIRTFILNKKYLIINVLIALVLMGIVVNQVVWLNNMYDLLQREYETNVNIVLQESIYKEINIRIENIGGFSVYSPNLNPQNDTSRFFSKDIITDDSTYNFVLDRHDSNTLHKISQFVLKNYLPVNLVKLTDIWKESITEDYKMVSTYFNYIDLENDTLIESNRPEDFKMTRYIKTDTLPLDIANSIGIVGFIEAPRWIILDKMKTQLRLSILLIVIAVVSLIYISRSFIFQLKTEKMRQESVNTMTHEFKRPISSAVAMASVIPFYLENKDQGKVLEYVENVETELNKLTFYTNRIQQISNNQKGKVALDIREVKIVPFFESLKQRYSSTNQDKQEIALNVHVHTQKDAMYVDLLHFSNVMDNLVENAIKYTVEPTILIDIQLRDRDDDGLEVSVKDNGIGISPKDIKYVFDKYYRVRRAETRNKTGYGLGLTYVESIVNAHGGSISVSSNLNRGSEFTIQLKRLLNGQIDTVG